MYILWLKNSISLVDLKGLCGSCWLNLYIHMSNDGQKPLKIVNPNTQKIFVHKKTPKYMHIKKKNSKRNDINLDDAVYV